MLPFETLRSRQHWVLIIGYFDQGYILCGLFPLVLAISSGKITIFCSLLETKTLVA